MIVSIIGLGLIGGSLAISIREKELAKRIIGVDNSIKNAEDALAIRLVDEIANIETAVPLADLIIIAVPVDQTKLILPKVLDSINNNSTVIDVGSTKEGICRTADQHHNRGNFVATHPIAGTENYGPLAAIQGLFNDKLSIICDREKSFDFAILQTERLYKSLGMKIINMKSKEHDLHAAYVSQLSHISSFTLGLTVLEIEKNEETIFELAGSGFASTVRLAKSSPDMWAPIFDQNSKHLLEALNAYIKNLQLFKKLIEKKQTKEIYNLMKEANDIGRILEGNKLIKEKQ
ncbi:MAG: prephenate dehydrogenase [Bacteroidetes bacterium]|nr:prephenate dehydrogenase [Bacteroidota bacterium]